MSPPDPPASLSNQPDQTDHGWKVSSEISTSSPELKPVVSTELKGSGPTVEDNMASQLDPTSAKEETGKSEDLIDFGDDPSKSVPKDTNESTIHGKLPETGQGDDKIRAGDGGEAMSSSLATLKPTTPTTTTPQYLTIETVPYVDPTPPTPMASQPPSRTHSTTAPRSRQSSESSPTRSDAAYDEKRYMSEDEQENGSRSEIQSIMEQFSEAGGGPGAEEVMSPRLEIASPLLGVGPSQHPPRKSSLEPLAPSIAQQLQDMQGLRLSTGSPASTRSKGKDHDDKGPPVPPKDVSFGPASPGFSSDSIQESPMSPTMPLHRPPPPEPEPEPTLAFDFHRFLEQLRNKKADPVARYLKSFLSEFGKKQWMVHEQVKIISDFLAFIANKMAQCEVWRDVSDAEFDNAREGMEKLVMNRLYSQTFSPAISPPQPIPGAKPKRRGGERPMGPGRRGQHQEDVERDEILAQKINIYGWVKEEHLDIPPVGDSGRRFLRLAQQGMYEISCLCYDANRSRALEDKIVPRP